MVKIDTFKVIKLLNSGNYFYITFKLASFWVLLCFFSVIQYENSVSRFQGRPGSPHIACAAASST